MEFCGDNSAYGTETFELNEERSIQAFATEGEGFPFGVRGLLPVTTSRRKKGGFKTVYALPLAPGEPDESDALARELHQAIDFVNLLLSEASGFSGHEFSAIGQVEIGIPAKGYCFSRVEEMPPGEDGRPPFIPIHLRIETSAKPGEPGSTSVVMEYDVDGYVRNVLMNQFGDGGMCWRATASCDRFGGDVLVQKVTENTPGDEPVELWRRSRRFPWHEGDGRDA